jgi:hypothetical protein
MTAEGERKKGNQSERGPSASLGMTRQKKKRRKKDGGREARRYIGKRKRAF